MATSEGHFFQVVLYLICRKCRHVFESRFRCLLHRPCLGDGEGVYRGTQQRFPPKYIENTFSAIQSTFRSLEMHSKRSFKICMCSVILGELESFRNYKGFCIFLVPEKFRCNLTFYETKNFSDSCLHYVFKSDNFRFPFCWKKKPNLGSEM